MKVFEITVKAEFLVLAKDKSDAIFQAEQATDRANDEMPRGANLACYAYETPNQTEPFKRQAINYVTSNVGDNTPSVSEGRVD